MILPDVNVLVNAFRRDARDHALCRSWLSGVVAGERRYAISPQVLASVMRVTTHPKVFSRPSNVGEVSRFCNVLLDQPHCHVITPGDEHWSIFQKLVSTGRARGNLISDAWFAALAIESGTEWITLDRDYARFTGLRWRRPS